MRRRRRRELESERSEKTIGLGADNVEQLNILRMIIAVYIESRLVLRHRVAEVPRHARRASRGWPFFTSSLFASGSARVSVCVSSCVSSWCASVVGGVSVLARRRWTPSRAFTVVAAGRSAAD